MTLLPFLLLVPQASRVAPQAHPVVPRFIAPPSAQELGMVRAFLREAYLGIAPGELDASLALNGEPKIEAPDELHPHMRRYFFSLGEIGVDVATGRIVFFSGGAALGGAGVDADGRIVPRRVTDREARAIAQRLYNALGLPGEITSQVKDLMGGNLEDLEVSYLPSVGGVPYANGQGTMLIDRQNGALHTLYALPTRADPPATLVPALSPEAARDIALRAGVDHRGEALDAPSPFGLRVWVPDDKPTPGEPAVATAARKAHRGVLAYAGGLVGCGGPRDFVYAVVDARTGGVLELRDSYPVSPGGAGGGGAWVGPGGGRGIPAPGGEPILPAAGPRPWRVAADSAPLSAPALAILAPVPNAAPTVGTRLALTDGRSAFPALYDPTTGLLAIDGKAYRPGPALATLLKRRAKG